jgi:hypothetical protein
MQAIENTTMFPFAQASAIPNVLTQCHSTMKDRLSSQANPVSQGYNLLQYSHGRC